MPPHDRSVRQNLVKRKREVDAFEQMESQVLKTLQNLQQPLSEPAPIDYTPIILKALKVVPDN